MTVKHNVMSEYNGDRLDESLDVCSTVALHYMMHTHFVALSHMHVGWFFLAQHSL